MNIPSKVIEDTALARGGRKTDQVNQFLKPGCAGYIEYQSVIPNHVGTQLHWSVTNRFKDRVGSVVN